MLINLSYTIVERERKTLHTNQDCIHDKKHTYRLEKKHYHQKHVHQVETFIYVQNMSSQYDILISSPKI
jgi:hypothetical protein